MPHFRSANKTLALRKRRLSQCLTAVDEIPGGWPSNRHIHLLPPLRYCLRLRCGRNTVDGPGSAHHHGDIPRLRMVPSSHRSHSVRGTAMETIFLICAIVGGTLLACQFLL